MIFQYFQVEVEQFNLFCLCSISNSLSLPLWYGHWGDIENKIINYMISIVITTWYIIYVLSCQYVLAGVWYDDDNYVDDNEIGSWWWLFVLTGGLQRQLGSVRPLLPQPAAAPLLGRAPILRVPSHSFNVIKQVEQRLFWRRQNISN